MTSFAPPIHALVIGFVVTLLSVSPAMADDGDSTPVSEGLWLESTTGDGPQPPDSPYAQLARQVSPSVVNILVSYDEGDLPPHARRSMPGPIPDHMAEGSGFIIHPDGYVVTNYHVIDNADKITVKLVDGTELIARVVGGDPMTDIALLSVDSDDPLPAVNLGESAGVDVGDYVVAIGNPLGLSHTVTSGIISALDRRDLPIEGREHQGNFIQIDAAINPGNSGGPLLDMKGEVIGINTAINQQGQGISFAIPVDLLKTLLPQLRDRGYVDRSWLGVRIQPMGPALAESFGLDHSRGALVTEVLDDSPASRAGIEERDVIVGVDGTTLDDSEELPLRISTISRESNVVLDVVRGGESRQLDVELESLPDQSPPDLPEVSPADTADRFAGVEVEANERGVVVTSLADDAPARYAGIRDRDVIVEVNSTKIDTVDDFRDAIEGADDKTVTQLKLRRSGQTLYKALTN